MFEKHLCFCKLQTPLFPSKKKVHRKHIFCELNRNVKEFPRKEILTRNSFCVLVSSCPIFHFLYFSVVCVFDMCCLCPVNIIFVHSSILKLDDVFVFPTIIALSLFWDSWVFWIIISSLLVHFLLKALIYLLLTWKFIIFTLILVFCLIFLISFPAGCAPIKLWHARVYPYKQPEQFNLHPSWRIPRQPQSAATSAPWSTEKQHVSRRDTQTPQCR